MISIPDNYITCQMIRDQLNFQKYVCFTKNCHKTMFNEATVQRKDNAKFHVRGNFEMWCVKCNVAAK